MTQGQEGPTVRGPRLWPFVGVPTFLRSRLIQDLGDLDADIAVLGAPTDEGSPFMAGSRHAPQSIRQQSLRFGDSGYYDPDEKREFLEYELKHGRLVDVGDASVLPTNVEDTFANITDLTKHVIDRGAMPVIIGGDHAISFPVVRAFTEPLHVMHFDAHMDYAPFLHGYMYTNGHAFRHIHNLPNVQSITQVGIRSLRTTRVMMEDSLKDGNRVVTMEEYRDIGHKPLVEELPANSKCYVSIDIDVLDMSLIPGCVSGEPEGMQYKQLRDMLRALAEHVEIVGFDLCEVNPLLDVGTNITSYLAAHTVVEFLGRITDQPRWIARREDRK